MKVGNPNVEVSTVGIVGCGEVAQIHARILAGRDGLNIAFCDRNIDRAQGLASTYGSTKVYTDVDRMIADEQLKALHVLTRLDSHRLMTEKALEAGVHVYVEKPITETKSEFETLRRLAERSHLIFYPGFSALGLPAARKTIEHVRSGAYGRLISAHCDYNWTDAGGGIPYGSGEHPAYSMRGGILQNLADHPASLVVDLLDDVLDSQSVRARRSNLPAGVHDLLHVALVGVDQVGSFTMSFGHGNASGTVICHLEGATIEADLRSQAVSVMPLQGVPSLQRRVRATLRAGAEKGGSSASYAAKRATKKLPPFGGIAALIDDFYAVIDEASPPIVSMENAGVVVDVLDSAWENAV